MIAEAEVDCQCDICTRKISGKITEEMADLFISKAADVCLKEIEALYRGERYIDEFQWAWK